MHRFALMVILLFSASSAFSQTSKYHRYIVQFTDKNNSPYSINNPLAYLSQRAIDRRNRQQIPITVSDLPINPSYIQGVLSTGVTLLNRSKWLNSISIETDDSLALLQIDQLAFVKSANPIAPLAKAGGTKMKTEKVLVADRDQSFSSTDYGIAFHQIDMLHGEWLHERGFSGQGVIIAILDAGYYNAPNLNIFDSLYNDNRVLGTRNFVTGESNVYNSETHGCSVLSTIAANLPGTMIGTAPHASFYLFVTEDGSSEYPIEEHNWAAGAEMADSLGADIISSSLGYSEFDDPSFNHTYADMNGNTTMCTRAADFAASKGIIVCSSAGNQGTSSWHYITAPADADSILTVGATDSTGSFTAFSSYGPTSDGDLKPNVVAQGIRVYVVNPFSGMPNKSNGTSFSNPIIAGMTACLWQAHPDLNNMEIIDVIQRSASLYNNPNDSMGNGIPNYQIADLLLSNKIPGDLTSTHPIVFPNPFSSSVNVIYSSQQSQVVNIEIFNVVGRKMAEFNQNLQNGYNYFSFAQLRNAADGYYFIRFNFTDHNDVIKLVKTD